MITDTHQIWPLVVLQSVPSDSKVINFSFRFVIDNQWTGKVAYRLSRATYVKCS